MAFPLTEPILDFKHPFIRLIALHLRHHRRHHHLHHLPLDSLHSNGSFIIRLQAPNLFDDKSRTNLFSQATQRRPSPQRMNHSNN